MSFQESKMLRITCFCLPPMLPLQRPPLPARSKASRPGTVTPLVSSCSGSQMIPILLTNALIDAFFYFLRTLCLIDVFCPAQFLKTADL